MKCLSFAFAFALACYPALVFAVLEKVDQFAIAEFLPANGLESSFSAGAGKALDNDRAYDNKLAQSFTATQTGRVRSIEIAVTSILKDAPVPLKVSIHKLEGGLPGEEIASSFIRFDTIPKGEELRLLQVANAFTAEAVFEKGPLLWGGRKYCIVWSSLNSPANYHISGTRQRGFTYPYGNSFRYNRKGECVPDEQSDFFFRISASSVSLVPVISVLALAAVLVSFVAGYMVARLRKGSNKHIGGSTTC